MTETLELPRSQAMDSRHRSSPGRAGPPDRQKELEMAVRLAAFLVSPIDYIDDEHCQARPFGPDQIRAIASHPAFGKPLNRLMADMIGFSAARFEPDMLARLATSPQTRLAVLLTTLPMAEAREAALTLAAAVLSEPVRGLVLKADRRMVREVLGQDGFHIAVHEVPLLYPSLCELDARSANVSRSIVGPGATVKLEEIVTFGIQVLGRFLDAVEPVFAELFSRRLPSAVRFGDRDRSVRPFGQIHCEQAMKLIRRRHPQWSAIIG